MQETGVKNILKKRHIIPEPDCKPLHPKGKPLGLSFFISLFVFYLCCCVLCLIIFVLEHIFKPKRSQRIQKPTKEFLRGQLCDKIDDFVRTIQKSQDMDTIIMRRKAILLLDEVKSFIEWCYSLKTSISEFTRVIEANQRLKTCILLRECWTHRVWLILDASWRKCLYFLKFRSKFQISIWNYQFIPLHFRITNSFHYLRWWAG